MLILTIIIIFVSYKCNLLRKITKFIYTFNSIKGFIKNIFFIIPILTIYLEKENISMFLNKNKKQTSQRNVSESMKKYVASNQKWMCNNCNNLLNATYEIDHIIPLYKGGNNGINNLQALCKNCHGLKTLNDKLNI